MLVFYSLHLLPSMVGLLVQHAFSGSMGMVMLRILCARVLLDYIMFVMRMLDDCVAISIREQLSIVAIWTVNRPVLKGLTSGHIDIHSWLNIKVRRAVFGKTSQR